MSANNPFRTFSARPLHTLQSIAFSVMSEAQLENIISSLLKICSIQSIRTPDNVIMIQGIQDEQTLSKIKEMLDSFQSDFSSDSDSGDELAYSPRPK